MIKKCLLFAAFALFVASPSLAMIVKVRAANVPLRAAPSATAAVVEQCKAGDILEFIDTTKDWHKVRNPRTGREGYVPASGVELLPGTVPVAAKMQAAKTPPGKAPARHRWTDRGYLMGGGIYQPAGGAFSDSFTEYQNAENAFIETEHQWKAVGGVDVSGGIRVWRDLALGVGFTRTSRSNDGTISGRFPHPFHFGQSRQVEGTVPLERTEQAVHVQAAWVVPAGRRVVITLAAGPSLFAVRQSLVKNAPLTEQYPYDTARLATPGLEQVSKSSVGFNAGVDLGYYFTKTFGLGVGARFSRAGVALPSHGSTVSSEAGGLQVGLGVRLRLPPSAPRKAPAKPPVAARPVKK